MAFSSRYNTGDNYRRVVALACRAQPGVWFELVSGLTRKQADGRLDLLRHRPSVPFRPAGAFEARKEQRDSGLFVVQVRYVNGM